jgi:hypothetical protein
MAMTHSEKGAEAPHPHLETSDLGAFLRLLPDEAITRLAELMVEMAGSDRTNRRHLPRAMTRQGLKGAQLIPDILDDLSFLGSHEIGSRLPYRELLRAVAMRHNIADDGTTPAASIERQIQAKYLASIRAVAGTFEDLGSSEWYRRLAFGVPIIGWAAYMMSPDWRTVTAVVLEVAALRRSALMREFHASLEA